MKKLLLSIITITAFSFGANAQNVNIPDANFKAYLVGNTSINTNADAEIQVSEANAYTGSIYCQSLSISDLTGIEAFTSLTVLYCSSNSLTTLDVSSNLALTNLNCGFNSLTSLDVSNNLSLGGITCNDNAISSLTIGNNTNLYNLFCENNQLTTLDISSNTILVNLRCTNNLLTDLNVANGNNTSFTSLKAENNTSLSCITVDDVSYSTSNWTGGSFLFDAGVSFSTNCNPPPCNVNIPDANFKFYLIGNPLINTNNNSEIECSEASAFTGTINCSNAGISDLTGIEAFTNLSNLDFQTNSVATVDLSANTALQTLICYKNSLTSLDLSNNSSLTYLNCFDNQLSNLDVANGNNTNVTDFYAITNPNLTCITVDNTTYSTTNWTNIDAQTSFSIDCNGCFVNIPDANFKTYLLGNTVGFPFLVQF